MSYFTTVRNALSSLLNSLPFLVAIFSGSSLYHTCFGRKIMRDVNGQRLTYRVQPQSYQEIKGTMFQPVIPKQEMSLSYVWNNVKHVPSRAPVMSSIFAISTIWASTTLCKRRNT